MNIEIETIASGLSNPLYVTAAGDGSNRLFILEKGGAVQVLQPGASAPTVFLDISAKVLSDASEQGLLGLAFHPQFSVNRSFYISYTRQPDGALIIAHYRASALDPNVAEAGESVFLEIPQPVAQHHSGMLAFGPDGLLYIGAGDSDHGYDPDNHAQNLDLMLGKILRVDVDRQDAGLTYAAPPDNPFFGPVPGRDEIYAVGFRNPWRFSFDRLTGQLYVADVGQDSREEINIVTRGGNYGWRVFEGRRCTNLDPEQCALDFAPPIIEYRHARGRCSVTGGYVYRGSQSNLPAGAYIYGDFCSGEIFMWKGGEPQLLLDTDLNISSFGEDEAGEIYVVGLGGTVGRLVNSDILRLHSVTIRRRSTGEEVQPLTIQENGRKFEVEARGTGFLRGSDIFINGRRMNTKKGEPAGETLIARLRRDTLAQTGSLTVEVVTPDGIRSNPVTLEVLSPQ
ncbi:MAG TPA: PQQ-dependent sugar dehydrogenase [Blastocatellia bacterium]|nr:PQQ-dependent sugar dehydrogenase [Blastocatellia bacterium]